MPSGQTSRHARPAPTPLAARAQQPARFVPVYALAIFAGAFLLFQVQPLIAKYILPWFGGSTGVWTTCMVFFQVLLLAGYAYAHVLTRLHSPRAQAAVHLLLLIAGLSLVPIIPGPQWKPSPLQAAADPTPRIIALLLACVGLPYFALSATGPLLQAWFARLNPGVSPYRLYAMSNIGSLLALVSYPFVFEPALSRHAQGIVWSLGLCVFAMVCGSCAWLVWRHGGTRSVTDEPRPAAGAAKRDGQAVVLQGLMWFLLPAVASVLLLAVTNKICQDVAVVPFLWVLPLSLYLLTFIICFDHSRWYARLVFLPLLVAALGAAAWALAPRVPGGIVFEIGLYSAILFVCCMVCHGETYRLRPEPRRLTSFYLLIAGGGAAGGISVGVVAPLVFRTYLELPIGLVACGLLATYLVCTSPDSPLARAPRLWVLTAAAAAWLVGGSRVYMYYLQADAPASIGQRIDVARNFYGVLTTIERHPDEPTVHQFVLKHGEVTHGQQFTDPVRRREPSTFYGPSSGVGLVLRTYRPAGGRRVGVVGLGAGTVAAYGKPGDMFRFYEINPQVKRMAEAHFTYLADSAARIECALGDARLSLERELSEGTEDGAPATFDVLVLDAFSGDAVPVHLLTREAFETYLSMLADGGVVAVHVTNRWLDLPRAIAPLCDLLGLKRAVVEYNVGSNPRMEMSSQWVLVTRDPAALDRVRQEAAADAAKDKPVTVDDRNPARPVRVWTDDDVNLFGVLKSN